MIVRFFCGPNPLKRIAAFLLPERQDLRGNQVRHYRHANKSSERILPRRELFRVFLGTLPYAVINFLCRSHRR